MEEEILYNQLIKNYLLLSDGDRSFFSQYKMSQARFYALVNVYQNPGISLTELSEKLLCTKGNTTRILKSLEKDQYLIRETDKTDRRAYQLVLSEMGLREIEKLIHEYQIFNQERFSSIPDIENLTKSIKMMNTQLEKQLS